MRKIITLLFALVALSAAAQFTQSDIGHLKQISKANLPVLRMIPNPNRSTSNISIDYDSFDTKWQHQHTPPDSMYLYSWNINKNNDTSMHFSLRYAVQTYDTLMDVNANFAGTAKSTVTARLDSMEIYLADSNASHQNDTLIITVFDKNTATVTGTGINQKLNVTALWSDSIISNTNILPDGENFYTVPFYPNVTVPAGHVLGVRIDFKGPVADQAFVLASYRDHCSSLGIGDTNKAAPRNSSFYWNYGAQSGVANYSTNLAFNTTNTCKYFLLQNFLFYPHLTLTTVGGVTPPTVVTTAATSVTSTGATLNGTVNGNGALTNISFDWGLTTAYGNSATGSPSTITANTAASAVLSGLTPNTTYHFRIKGVNGGGTSNGNDLTFTTTASGNVCTPDAGVTSGIGPSSANTTCIQQGVSYSQTFTFVIPATAAGGAVTVNSVHIDSVGNLPTGITAQFSQTPATYNGGATGCFILTGTTNFPCGQYQMPLYVTITTTPGGTNSGELSSLANTFGIAGYEMHFLRLIGAAGTCPAVNSSQSTRFVAGSCGTTANITASITKTDVQCFSESSGSATVTASGGSNYTYLWSNGATTQTASNLPGGNYTVTVTSGSATATASVTINAPTSGVNAGASATTTTCGQSTGTATVNPSGGTPGYTYLWSTGSTNASISGLASGNYNVTVSDSHGCNSTATVQVTTPNGPSATTNVTNVSCFGGSTGGVTVTETGGTGTIAYHWSNAAITQNLTNVAAGNYNLTVSDANNCSFSLSATVNQPSAALVVTGNVTNTTGGLNNGAVSTNVTGGTPNYTYSWSSLGSGSGLSEVAAGTYSVTVTDQNNCTASASFTVGASTGINGIDMVNKFTVFPNPASSSVNIQLNLTETADMKIELVDLTGKVILSENTGKVSQLNYMLNTSSVSNGVYVVRITGTKFHVVKQLTISK